MIKCKYIVSCTTYYGETIYRYYGFSKVKEGEKGLEIIKEYNCLISNKEKISRLVKMCNRLDVSEDCLDELVEDLIFNENGV